MIIVNKYKDLVIETNTDNLLYYIRSDRTRNEYYIYIRKLDSTQEVLLATYADENKRDELFKELIDSLKQNKYYFEFPY